MQCHFVLLINKISTRTKVEVQKNNTRKGGVGTVRRIAGAGEEGFMGTVKKRKNGSSKG